MNKKTIFSIIIPAYNCEELIKSTIDSIISQESIYECIVIDGGSTDRTIDIVKEYINISIFIYIFKNKNRKRI